MVPLGGQSPPLPDVYIDLAPSGEREEERKKRDPTLSPPHFLKES